MLSIILISVVAVQIIAALVVVVMMKRAPEGYEDHTGFHAGAEPEVVHPEPDDSLIAA